MNEQTWAAQFSTFARGKLTDYHGQITRCAALLSDAQVWQRANENCNSVGNLILHLRGNVNQWIVEGVGGKAGTRDRPAEFAQREIIPKNQILPPLERTIREAKSIIETVPDVRWPQAIDIQGYSTTVLSAVFHVVEHFAFHTGQIIHMTKAILDVDLSLYDAQGHRRDGRLSGVP